MKQCLFLWLLSLVLFPSVIHAEDQDQVRVHFLNVGQADSILVQTPGGKNVLIDGGTNAATDKIISYLEKQDVNRINMLIATHPHHDHIGSMDKLLDTLAVDMLYIPPLSHKTRSYHELQKAVWKNETTVIEAKTGQSVRLAKDIRLDVLAPRKGHYKKENDDSLVTKLTHGDNRFLLMADAGKKSEQDMLKKQVKVDADVLKVGHHGGASATSGNFLTKVDPDYAIITAGDHANFPSQDVVNRLKRKNVTLLNTHRLGTIVAVSNGESIAFYMKS